VIFTPKYRRKELFGVIRKELKGGGLFDASALFKFQKRIIPVKAGHSA
jgi:hypothetical protein